MNDPRNITDAAEIRALLETRHSVHFSEAELLFELDDGGLLSIRGQSNYLYATHYPPGWRDGFDVRDPETVVEQPKQEPQDATLWLIVMLVAAALTIGAYWMAARA